MKKCSQNDMNKLYCKSINVFSLSRQDTGGCFDQLSPVIGLTFCGELSVPMDGLRVLSPAYGPSKASLRLEKDDESLTSYHFKAFYNNKRKCKRLNHL